MHACVYTCACVHASKTYVQKLGCCGAGTCGKHIHTHHLALHLWQAHTHTHHHLALNTRILRWDQYWLSSICTWCLWHCHLLALGACTLNCTRKYALNNRHAKLVLPCWQTQMARTHSHALPHCMRHTPFKNPHYMAHTHTRICKRAHTHTHTHTGGV